MKEIHGSSYGDDAASPHCYLVDFPIRLEHTIDMLRYLCFTVLLLLTSCTPTPDAKKLGLSPDQVKEFEKHTAAGNFYLTIGSVTVVSGILALGDGIWYQYARRKKPS